mmetsp:Transcript_31800/g.91449  ORF Transcript_31800/g.91449 Transcript_31800/m.91449 type:complete len:227 (+) Transcript_31800:1520-2200(+)
MFTRPRLWISACSSKRRMPAFKGTTLATANVLIDQDTVIEVMNEAVIPQFTAFPGRKLLSPLAKHAKGDHHSTLPGKVRCQDGGGHAPPVASLTAAQANTEAISTAGVPKLCASRALATAWAYAMAKITCTQAEAVAQHRVCAVKHVALTRLSRSSPAASARDSSRMRKPLPAKKPPTTVYGMKRTMDASWKRPTAYRTMPRRAVISGMRIIMFKPKSPGSPPKSG